MSENKKDEKEYILNGVITSAGSYAPNTERFIEIQSRKGNIYSCTVPTDIFSNYQEDDIIKCALAKKDDGTYIMLRKPFISLSTGKDAIERCFVRALKGTGCGPVAAGTFYEGIRNVTKLQNNDLSKPNEETVYGTDGVVKLITRLSTNYKENGDQESVAFLVACGMRDTQAKKLLNWWHKCRCTRRLHLIGLNNDQIKRCRMDCDEIYRICITKPLTLASVSMDICLFLLENASIPYTKKDMRCGEILRKVDNFSQMSAYACVKASTMEWHFKDFFLHREQLAEEYGVILDGNMVYLQYNYDVEVAVAEYFDKLIKQTAVELAKQKDCDVVSLQERNYTIDTLTDEQKEAINGALRCKISVITGGAGTGKTTISKEIWNNLTARQIKMVAGAYTGKAVVRLNEIFDREDDDPLARTLDLMIARNKGDNANDADFQVILIDESSMATTELIYRLITTFTHDFSIIIMGDCNQLPPIGWGFFMKQIIACGRVPIFTLTKNQRLKPPTANAEEEEKMLKDMEGKAPSEVNFDRTILRNCQNLIDPKRDLSEPMTFEVGSNTDMSTSKGFYIIEEGIDFIEDMLLLLKQGGTPVSQIKAICPFVKDGYIARINRMFQNVYLNDVEGVIHNGITYKVGDNMMLLKNNYEVNVFNGEEGKTVAIDEKGIKVQFKIKVKDGVTLPYNPNYELYFYFEASEGYEDNKANDLLETNWAGDKLYVSMLSHSFCVSVHKSQGSEYPFVLLFIPEVKNTKNNELSSFLNIQLLYVALSRTQKTCWYIGKERVLGEISMKKAPIRVDNLANRISKMRDPKIEKITYTVKVTPKEGGDFEYNKDEDDIPISDEDEFWG